VDEWAREREILQARHPLPDWVVDSEKKRRITLLVAQAIANEREPWPRFRGPMAQHDYAELVSRAAYEAIAPLVANDSSDGISYLGDVLVRYIAQLSLKPPIDPIDPDGYRELLRLYTRHLTRQAQRFGSRTQSKPDPE
jgi:hypothetical protein